MRFSDFNSIHNRNRLAAAIVLAAQLAACSSNAGGNFTPASALPAVAAPATSGISHSNPVRKPEELCEPVVYNGIGWQYEGGTIGQWWEFAGPWADIGGRLVPCSSTPIAKDPINPFFNAYWGEVILSSYWFQVKQCFQYCFVNTSPYSNVVTVYTYHHHGLVPVASMNTAPYLPMGLAVSPKGSLYVSVAPGQGSSDDSGILVYPKGQTKPSGMLRDTQAAQNAETIAVDGTGNLYVAYNLSESGKQVAHIDKFPEGKSSAIPFATIDGVTVGGIAATKGGDVVASVITPSGGNILTYNPKGSVSGEFATTADPTSVSINKKNDALTVSDAANNLVSTYAYPSGTLQSQLSLGSASQTWEPGGMIQP